MSDKTTRSIRGLWSRLLRKAGICSSPQQVRPRFGVCLDSHCSILRNCRRRTDVRRIWRCTTATRKQSMLSCDKRLVERSPNSSSTGASRSYRSSVRMMPESAGFQWPRLAAQDADIHSSHRLGVCNPEYLDGKRAPFIPLPSKPDGFSRTVRSARLEKANQSPLVAVTEIDRQQRRRSRSSFPLVGLQQLSMVSLAAD